MRGKKNRSIFRLIFLNMLTILCLEFILLFGCLYFGKVGEQINDNERSILDIQTDNRKNYLENMLMKNHELTLLEDKLDSVVMEMAAVKKLDLEALSLNREDSTALLQEISSDLIDVLRQKNVTGIFVVLNTEDLDKLEEDADLSGIYIRDSDPDASPSYRNADLFLECSPIELVKSMFIATDTGWNPTIAHKQATDPQGFIYPVFQTAFHAEEKLDASDYGRLTTTAYTLDADNKQALAYSIPLILPNGTVYGVLGVEMLNSYLESLLPYEELKNDNLGMYLLAHVTAQETDSEMTIQVAAASENFSGFLGKELLLTSDSKGISWKAENGSIFCASVKPLHIYNRNAPFSSEEWLLIGAVPMQKLFAFSQYIVKLLTGSLLMTMLVGFFCIVFISRQLSRPIMRLAEELNEAQQFSGAVLELQPTHVRELDVVSSAITELNQAIINTAAKFQQIIKMASVELAGYEVRYDTETVYVTDNFFELLGMPEKQQETLTISSFEAVMQSLNDMLFSDVPFDGKVYRIPLASGTVRYVRIKEAVLEYSKVGVAEDETGAVSERLRIEYERDYDSLTNLYNRRAFMRIYEALFQKPEQLKHAVFVMLDMDNLKGVNDTFGHDAGDVSIRQIATCLQEYMPKNALCGHLSGDEFVAFLYGYDTEEKARQDLDFFQEALSHSRVQLTSETVMTLSVSGGTAWYPRHSTDALTLKKYADFAMYQVKKSTKGAIAEFREEDYQHELDVTNMRKEFFQLITEKRAEYHFQPIVSARTGQPAAYEALMRTNMPSLRRPDEVLQIAKEESCLHEIECITWFKAAEAFQKLKEKGQIKGDEFLFINSIQSQHLNEREEKEFVERYAELSDRIVVELTESEDLNREVLERKQKFVGFTGDFALDDYGSGYSNSQYFLELSPKYLKLDRSIVQNVDQDSNKQQLISYIVGYAHQHHLNVIAEGLETQEELEKTLELGVDFFQGYYLARPMPVPGDINPKAVELILHKKE